MQIRRRNYWFDNLNELPKPDVDEVNSHGFIPMEFDNPRETRNYAKHQIEVHGTI